MTLKLRFLPAIFVIVISSMIFAQTDEANDYKSTTSISDPAQRIEALQKFISSHTDSDYLVRAYSDLYNLYAGKGDEKLAIEYAEKYLNSYPEETRMNRYNSVAYTLAEKNIGLKSALVYAQKAVDMAKNASPRSFRQILDTQAFVLYRVGNVDSALVLEREAIKGNENDPSYLYYLSLYEEATGHTTDALMHSAKAVLNGDGVNAISKFNEWVNKTAKTDNEKDGLKNKIVDEAIKEYLSESDAGRKRITNSNAAAFMAKMNSNLMQAETMALESLSGVNEKTPIDELINLKSNFALVYTALGKYDKAIAELKTVENFASPYDSDYWLTLGNSYEKSGEIQKSLDAYVNGLIAYAFPNIMSAAETLMKENNIETKVLTDKIKLEKENALNFNPGEYNKKNESGKIVLAELFTGAECPPCVATDMAFDKLSEYYPRTDLAILEYHVHIPGPDPMTNPDTFKRYKFYGGNYGTPTVFLMGRINWSEEAQIL